MKSLEKEEFFKKKKQDSYIEFEQNSEKFYHSIEINEIPIKFLTYNIILRPPLLKNNDDDFKNERTKLFLKSISKYDIICLQEIFELFNYRKQKIISKAIKRGFHYHAESPSPSFFIPGLVDAGLLTLSKFPIISNEFFPFNYCVLADATAQKGVLYTKIKIYNEILHLFNLHTQASYVGNSSDIKATLLTRIDQFKTFRKVIEKCLKKYKYKKKDLVMILGDLNINAKNPYFPKEVICNLPGVEGAEHDKGFNEYNNFVKIITNNSDDEIVNWFEIAFPDLPTIGESVFDGEKELPYETIITHKDDLMTNQTLDYVLEFLPKDEKFFEKNFAKEVKDVAKKKLKIDPNTFEIEKFNVDNPFFSILSDHYGISGSILFENNN